MDLMCHPDRPRVLAELHARPFIAVETPHRVLHFAFQVSTVEAEADRQRIERLFGGAIGTAFLEDRRHVVLEGGRLLWERHGEFINYTLALPFGQKACWPEHLVQPGKLLVAVDLRLIPDDLPQTKMVHAAIVGGQAVISSDFRQNEEGFVEITIGNRDMPKDLAGATVQRVLEMETYRCFALLGLPLAEEAAKVMRDIEHDLPTVMEKMDASLSLEANRDLLDRLTSMTLALERSSAATHFRFGATKAYAELVRLRLDALGERPTPGQSGLASFFSRRFEPAMRTCATASDREANLSRKLTRAAQLLRTRVEITLESQNGVLLETMGNRVQLQLRLQQTVEGLSVAAIAYYVTSLFHLLISGLEPVRGAVAPDVLTSLATVPIVVSVALLMRHIRRHHNVAA